jgi:hypothetical protein
MFRDCTSLEQQAAVGEVLRARLGAPPGTEIPYRDTCPVERRGSGYYRAVLQAEWANTRLDFTVVFLNRAGQVNFRETGRVEFASADIAKTVA